MQLEYKGDLLDVNYIEKGTGKTVVLLEGWGTAAVHYACLSDMLSEYCHVIVPDFPGFGKTTEPSFPYSTEDYADFVILFLKKLGITDASFIGHSHGGRVIIELASREKIPVHIEKIVLIDSAGIVNKKSLKKRAKIMTFKVCKHFLMIPFVNRAYPDSISKLRVKFGSADYASSSRIMQQSMVKLVNTDYSEKLHLITRPTLLIWGENDDATPLSNAKRMEKEIADSGLVTIRNAGHFSFLADLPLVERVLKSFFEF